MLSDASIYSPLVRVILCELKMDKQQSEAAQMHREVSFQEFLDLLCSKHSKSLSRRARIWCRTYNARTGLYKNVIIVFFLFIAT